MTTPIPPELALEQPPFELDHLEEVLATGRLTDEQVDEYAEQIAPELVAVHRWHVTDDYNAEWAMRMLAAILLERQGIEEQFDLWLTRVREARDAALRPLERRAGYFDGELRTYAMRVRRDDPTRATITLPSGKISTNAAKKPTVEVLDEEEFIQWAAATLSEEDYGSAIKTVESPRIMEIRKLVRVDEKNVIDNDDGHGNVEQHTEYSVVWASTGEVVSGLSAAFAETTATAKPAL